MLFCMQVVGLTTALGTIQGTDTGTFAIGLVLSLVVSLYSLMLGTLFAQLGHTEPSHGQMAMQLVRKCADKQVDDDIKVPLLLLQRA